MEVDGIQGSSGVHAGGQEERRGAHGVKRTAKGDFEERGLGIIHCCLRWLSVQISCACTPGGHTKQPGESAAPGLKRRALEVPGGKISWSGG